MSDEPERQFYAEAVAILAGESLMLPEKAHMEALEEMREVDRIRFANMLETLKQQVLRGTL